MSGLWRLLAICTGVALCGGTGCIHYRYGHDRLSMKLAEEAEVPGPARAKVHTFIMNGIGPIAANGVEALETAIVKAGYAKVYVAQRVDRAWFYQEIHRLHRDDAENRFILISQSAATAEMQKLADCLANDGIPLDGVIFLDPNMPPVENCAVPGYPVRVIRSSRFLGETAVQPTDCVQFTDIGPLTLAGHPGTASQVIAWIIAAGRAVPYRPAIIECNPQTGEPKPVPRPDKPKVNSPTPPAWDNVFCPTPGQ